MRSAKRQVKVSLCPFNEDIFARVPRLARLHDFVNKHYADHLTLKTAAQVAGLERCYFSKFFRKSVGICYHDWLAHVRIARAVQLLRYSHLSITDIAYEVGFCSLGSFERAIKRLHGICPSELRRRVLYFHSDPNSRRIREMVQEASVKDNF